jgi:uncharacterized cupredoxin-like copper-binding protein
VFHAAAAALLVVPAAALGHGDGRHAAGAPKKEQKPWGIAGDARSARRTIDVQMLDAMRFSPEQISVRAGEIVWTFNRPGEFEFACLVSGHYQAGMSGKITASVAP